MNYQKYICLDCRKVFKKVPSEIDPKVSECPDCKKEINEIGESFRAPRKDDIKKWNWVKEELNKGRSFTRDEQFYSGSTVKNNKSNYPKTEFQKPNRKRNKD